MLWYDLTGWLPWCKSREKHYSVGLLKYFSFVFFPEWLSWCRINCRWSPIILMISSGVFLGLFKWFPLLLSNVSLSSILFWMILIIFTDSYSKLKSYFWHASFFDPKVLTLYLQLWLCCFFGSGVLFSWQMPPYILAGMNLEEISPARCRMWWL